MATHQASEEGTHHARRPKTTPVRHRTLPARAWAKVLISEVTPTMNSDAAMASGFCAGDVGQQRNHQEGTTTTEKPESDPHDHGKDQDEDQESSMCRLFFRSAASQTKQADEKDRSEAGYSPAK